eukprot:m.1668725 g.1668725  ORF g.1668725 m.1668725 type:complete len:51 (-) comp154274_c0_seq1:42-194(-)
MLFVTVSNTFYKILRGQSQTSPKFQLMSTVKFTIQKQHLSANNPFSMLLI